MNAAPQLTEQQKTIALLVSGLLAYTYLTKASAAPKWVSQMPPINPRRAGAWRGRGSFGKAPFGSQTKR